MGVIEKFSDAELRAGIAENKTARDLAEGFGVNVETVRRRLRKLGLQAHLAQHGGDRRSASVAGMPVGSCAADPVGSPQVAKAFADVAARAKPVALPPTARKSSVKLGRRADGPDNRPCLFSGHIEPGMGTQLRRLSHAVDALEAQIKAGASVK